MKNALLWRLTPPGGGPDAFLFGTMHVRDLRAFGWFDAAKACLAQCDIFATEFDFGDTDPATLAGVLTLPEGQILESLLRPGVWKSLARYNRKKLHIPLEHLSLQHPMAVTVALTNALLEDETPLSLDESLWEYARSLGKRTTGVESFEDQIVILTQIPLEQQLKNLTWMVKNYNRQKRRLRKMLQWYENGDIQHLYHAAKRDAKGLRKLLLYTRNTNMAARFAELTAQGSLFCAVGAGHLAGQKGMLRLLKKAGFVIKPVSKTLPPGSSR